MKPGWKQIRLFSNEVEYSSYTHFWSLNILGNVIRPMVMEYPRMKFWFTNYYCDLNTDGDNADGLPEEFIDGNTKLTKSVRFRFLPTNREQIAFLKNLIKEREDFHWYCGVEDYDHYNDLCGPRFVESTKKSERLKRGNLVQKLLECNCRLILMSLINGTLGWRLETNSNSNNKAFGNISRSITHLLINPWKDSNAMSLPIYRIDWSAISSI